MAFAVPRAWLLLGWMIAGACAAPPNALPQPPRTVPEQTGHTRTSSHAEVMAFLRAVEGAGDPRVRVTSFGVTPQGREMPLVVVADPAVANAAAARAAGKPRVLVMANIHAGEVEGKEACLELLREVVWGTAPYPVGEVVLLLAPIYNADGNDDFAPDHRPFQNGPDETGTRQTAAGLDLNRDYMKLEAPEARRLVRLFCEWDPHVVVDLHTTNGSAHGYELTYAPPLSPSCDPELLRFVSEEWLAVLRDRMRERHGFETFDYGNFMTEEGRFKDEPDRVTGWRTFDHRPRFGNNYVGLRNRVAILSEAYSCVDFETRIAVTRAFVEEILQRAAELGEPTQELCRRLDAETARAGAGGGLEQAVGVEPVARDEPEPLLLRPVELRRNPRTGAEVRAAAGERQTIEVPCFVEFRAVEQRSAPRAYWLPPEQAEVAAHLERHGILLTRAEEPVEQQVAVFRLAELDLAEREFQGHHAVSAGWERTEEVRELPAGSVRVPMDQPLARLVFQILDPRADDGLVVWNFFDASLAAGVGAELPVYGELQ